MSNFNCGQFETLLEQAVEQRQPLAPELRDHAASCVTCRALWDEFQILEEAIPAWSASAPSVNLVDSVMSGLAAERTGSKSADSIAPLVALTVADSSREEPPRRRRFLFAAAATTVAALLLVSAGFYFARPAADAPQIANTPPQIVVPNLNRPMATPPIEQSPSEISVMVADAGTAYLQLASNAAAAVTEGVALFPSTKLVADASPKPSSNRKSWVQQFEKNLQPLQKDIGSAFEFLFEAPAPDAAPAT
jgi:hypothetical protein